LAIAWLALPTIKKLRSSVPLAEVSKRKKKNHKHVFKRIFTSGLALSAPFA
jgi:hypothetical protein